MTVSKTVEINEALAVRVLKAVDAGLVRGKGDPIPGQMCVEAAVCFAMGLPHSDEPQCVGLAVRAFNIRLNDSRWSSNKARAKGMRQLAIAQLGSDTIDQRAFVRMIVAGSIRQILPITLRRAASLNPNHADALEASATRCEQEGTADSAKAARDVAREVRDCADAYADAYAAYATAASAAYAYADAYATACADACAAYATAAAAATADADFVLNKAAAISIAALIELKSPGCAFLHLTEAL